MDFEAQSGLVFVLDAWRSWTCKGFLVLMVFASNLVVGEEQQAGVRTVNI